MTNKYYTNNTYFQTNSKVVGVAFRIPKNKVTKDFSINDIVIIEIYDKEESL